MDHKWCPCCLSNKPKRHFRVLQYAKEGYAVLCITCEKSADPKKKGLIKLKVKYIEDQLRRATKRGLPAYWNDELWHICKGYWHYRCAVCDSPEKIVPDHWIPIDSKDCPGTVPDNIIPLCHRCNAGKRNRDATRWLTTLRDESFATLKMAEIQAFFNWFKKRGW